MTTGQGWEGVILYALGFSIAGSLEVLLALRDIIYGCGGYGAGLCEEGF